MPAQNSRTPFIGRERELALLLDHLEGAAQGQGRLVLVGGEPGVGKTRLLAELADDAKAEGWQVLAGRAYDSEGMPPYLPFSEALRDYVRTASLEDLRAQLDEAGPEVALLAPDIRRRLPDLPTSPPAGPEEQRYRLFESVCDFLLGIPGHWETRGLVLILDDLHWADPSSLLLFQHLARRLTRAPVLLAGAYRSEEVSRSHPLAAVLADLRRESIGERLALAPLPAAAIEALVRELAGVAPAPEVLQAVEQQTEGNPFFVCEVIRDLLANRRDLTAPATAMETSGVPEGVREVIERRLGRLSRPTNGMLQTAAVLGDGFNLQELRAALESQPLPLAEGRGEGAVLTDALDEATGAGMLREAGDGYQFGHALIRQTLYDGLGLAHRQELHLRAAEALERVHAGNLGPRVAAVAMHYRLADGQGEKALDYAERAAQRALASYAYAEAARHIEQALEVLDPDEKAKRCDLLLALGEALMPAGEPARVFESVAPQALSLAQSQDNDAGASRACHLALNALHRFGALSVASTPEWQRWTALADQYAMPESLDRARTDLELAFAALSTDHLHEAWERTQNALRLAELHNNSEIRFWAGSLVAGFSYPPAYGPERRRLAEYLLSRPAEGVSARTLGWFLANSGIAFLDAGQREKTEEVWGRLRELATRSADAWVQLRADACRLFLLVLDGLLEEAVGQATGIKIQADSLGMSVAGLGQITSAWRRALMLLGRGPEAVELFLPPTLERQAGAALRLASANRLREASDILGRLKSETLVRSADQEHSVRDLAVLLETAVLLGDAEAAAQVASAFAGTDNSLANCDSEFVCLPRLLGGAAALLGETDKARACYEQSLEVAGKIRFRPEIALTHLGLAELLFDGHAGAMSRAPTRGGAVVPLSQAGEGRGEGGPRALGETHAEALKHLHIAIAELRDMNMQPALERALQLEQRAAEAPPHRRVTAAIYPDGLSDREVEVLRLVAAGRSNQAIADTLVISLSTVLGHISHIFAKTNSSNRTEAAGYAHRYGLTL